MSYVQTGYLLQRITNSEPYTIALKVGDFIWMGVEDDIKSYITRQWDVARRPPLSTLMYVESCASGRLLDLYAQDTMYKIVTNGI